MNEPDPREPGAAVPDLGSDPWGSPQQLVSTAVTPATTPIEWLLDPTPIIEEPTPPPAPITIDLPDGQKILIGDVPAGSVIEVATWHGPGRPDSRTNRLVVVVDRTDRSDRANGDGSKRSGDRAAALTEAAAQTPEHSDPPGRRRRVARAWSRRWVRVCSYSSLGLAALVVAFILSPLGLIHPTSGMRAGYGPARSTIVITRPMSALEPGMAVVSRVPGKPGTVLGHIVKWQGDAALIQTETGFYQVRVEDISGRVVAVVPLLGYLWW